MRVSAPASSLRRIASSIPLMNFTDSSVLKVRASSRASLITTAGGVPAGRSSSQMARRRISRSMTAIRSGRQRSRRVGDQRVDARQPPDRVGARSRREGRAARSGGGASSGHCSEKNVSAARATSVWPISHW